MHEDYCSNKPIREKQRSKDTLLMDQNVFNLVFAEKVKLLPIIYSLLYTNLLRARDKYDIQDINDIYHSLEEIRDSAYIVHFLSRDKHWKYSDVPLGSEWLSYYVELKLLTDESELKGSNNIQSVMPKVSVIIPVHNTAPYLHVAINSILAQSLGDIDIICINDGSTDESLSILKEFTTKDSRIVLLFQYNKGLSVARNRGLKLAHGKYAYFFDSDDILKENALEGLFNQAETDHLDMFRFDGESFFESDEFKESFSSYDNYYARYNSYPGIWLGSEIYSNMVNDKTYRASVCLQFFQRDFLINHGLFFKKGLLYEDNPFSLQAIIKCKRVGYIPKRSFVRRVRNNSIVTQLVSYNNFSSSYNCLISMRLFVIKNELQKDTTTAIERQLKSLYKTTYKYFQLLLAKKGENLSALRPMNVYYLTLFIKVFCQRVE